MNDRSSASFTSSPDAGRARRAQRLFFVVAALCVIQVGWYLTCEFQQAERKAELEKSELDLKSLQITILLNNQVSKLWDEVHEMVMDTAWTGGVPRSLNEHTLVYNVNRFPTVTKRIQSPFGQYNMDNWTWAIQGPRDTLWITLDPLAVSNIVVANDSSFEFRGEAPFPGLAPFRLDPPPVRPTVATVEQLDRKHREELIFVTVQAVIFLFLVIAGLFLLYRTAVRTA